MKRTILYSPEIIQSDNVRFFPSKESIRRALLYVDKIKFFAPEYYGELDENSVSPMPMYINSPGEYDDMEFANLVALGLQNNFIEAIIPKTLFDKNKDLEKQFTIHLSQRVEVLNKIKINNDDVSFLPFSIVDFDALNNFYKVNSKNIPTLVGALQLENHSSIAIVQKDFAKILIDLLTEYFNIYEDELTVPFSNESLSHFTSSLHKKDDALSITLNNCLPFPSDSTSFEDILEFKLKRRTELLNFNETLTNLVNEVSKQEDHIAIKNLAYKFSKSIELNINAIERTLKESKIDFVLGCFENLIKMETPALTNILVSSGLVSATINPLVGVGMGALLMMSSSVNKLIRENNITKTNEFAYLFYAKKEGIVL